MNTLLNLSDAEWTVSEDWLGAGLEHLSEVLDCSDYPSAQALWTLLLERVSGCWKQAARLLHPDRIQGDGSMLAQINRVAEMWRDAEFLPATYDVVKASLSQYDLIDNEIVTTKGVVRVVWK